jgi:hypothetical protein
MTKSDETRAPPPKRAARRWLRSTLWEVLALVGCFAVYLALDLATSYREAPPSAGCTVAELQRKIGPPHRLAIIDMPDGKRLVWLGDTPRWIIRSGPPCYVFDDRGRLLEWCAETGEGGHVDQLTRAAWTGQSLTLAEAIRWCERPAASDAAANGKARPVEKHGPPPG